MSGQTRIILAVTAAPAPTALSHRRRSRVSTENAGVTVTRDDHSSVKHETATRFQNDSDGNLSVYDGDGLIAMYAAGRWVGAFRVAGVTSEAQ
jgi:hypothetical protein